jgi:shikimate 5-dehydrogenase
MSLPLEGKVALVTGGAGGIGAVISRALAAAGARVVVTYRDNRARAEALIASLPGSGNTPGRWLDPDVAARIDNATALRLGPEPLIGAQRITLMLDGQTRVLATDGLSPFAVAEPAATPP